MTRVFQKLTILPICHERSAMLGSHLVEGDPRADARRSAMSFGGAKDLVSATRNAGLGLLEIADPNRQTPIVQLHPFASVYSSNRLSEPRYNRLLRVTQCHSTYGELLIGNNSWILGGTIDACE